ncbi:hypothetical protein MITS9509_00406 [Synechococcus sp. MIT S9509]|uniref:hypothetical protein n=1 Tax=unclassified Synechococcus TaxID=2626047 RepID=UPI0007BB7496|nr:MULTISPECIES: hypothetical protein [unclassified Synechococcus]KZR85075.1 hypothetical protein MITS9504_02510 [Synechococcus sp. MIT S9504]KZR93811.1 hypothetical protein MITS9509_00406 [Synechococcus sp. MIT S9509]
MKSFTSIAILMAAGAFSGIEVSAPPRSISEYSRELTAKGYKVIDKDKEDNHHEFEAIKANKNWDI